MTGWDWITAALWVISAACFVAALYFALLALDAAREGNRLK